MVERRQQIRLQGAPRNMGPAVTAGSVPLTRTQCCMHRPGVKCMQANGCPCQAANRPCTSGCPSENCHNQGPTRLPTAPTLTTNVIESVEESQEAVPTICHATPPGCFPLRLTGVLTQRPTERRGVACPTGVRRHSPCVPSANRDRRP